MKIILLSLCTRFQLWKFACRLSWARFSFAFGSGNSHFVQLLFCWGLFRMFSDKKYGSPQNAITVWKDHMVSQGFGYRLGTDLPGEQRGLIPNAKFYDKAYRGSWNGLTVISIAIGQEKFLRPRCR